MGIDPTTTTTTTTHHHNRLVVPGGVIAETQQAIKNTQLVFFKAYPQLGFDHALGLTATRCNLFVSKATDVPAVENVYQHFFEPYPTLPARVTLVVALPKNASIAIQCFGTLNGF